MAAAASFQAPIFAQQKQRKFSAEQPSQWQSQPPLNSPNPLLLGQLEEKPKAVLSHELGAGSACLKCGDRCEGLDLHFWRKICKNCSCRLDDHDVILSRELDHGEFVIRKLFGSRPRSATYTSELSDRRASDDRRSSKDEVLKSEHSGIVEKLRQFHLNAAQNVATQQPQLKHNGGKVALINTFDHTGSNNRNNGNASDILLVEERRLQSPAANVTFADTSFISPANHHKTKTAAAASSKTVSWQELYAWLPAGDHQLVERYMQCLPVTERPLRGTNGAQLRRQRLAQQLPYHDCDTDAAKSLQNDDERDKHRNFVEFVKDNVVGIGEIFDATKRQTQEIGVQTSAVTNENYNNNSGEQLSGVGRWRSRNAEATCRTCAKTVNDVGVVTEHGADEEVWHANCFRCEVCHQLLADLLYFYKDGRYFCGRHYSECVYPRCAGCDELIFAREYTFAEEKPWHLDHFCCFGCDLHLGGHRYVTKEDNTYCIDCYMRKFARTCSLCKNKIAPFDSRISHRDLNWHANENCFKCCVCSKALCNQKFSLKDQNVFCGAACSREFTAKKQSA